MGGVTFNAVNNRVVGIGDNKFESGSISVAAGATVAAGAALSRAADGKFQVAQTTTGDDAEVILAVNPFDFKNEGTATAVLGFRAIIGGEVRKDMVTVGGVAVTTEQADMLRDYGIIVVAITAVSDAVIQGGA
jgi:hypothetical protein